MAYTPMQFSPRMFERDTFGDIARGVEFSERMANPFLRARAQEEELNQKRAEFLLRMRNAQTQEKFAINQEQRAQQEAEQRRLAMLPELQKLADQNPQLAAVLGSRLGLGTTTEDVYEDVQPPAAQPGPGDMGRAMQGMPMPGMQQAGAALELRERGFQDWYGNVSKQLGLDSNPDAPEHKYDYRAFYGDVSAGNATSPEQPGGHFPSTYKMPGHPREFLRDRSGRVFDTKTATYLDGSPVSQEELDASENAPDMEAPPLGQQRARKLIGHRLKMGDTTIYDPVAERQRKADERASTGAQFRSAYGDKYGALADSLAQTGMTPSQIAIDIRERQRYDQQAEQDRLDREMREKLAKKRGGGGPKPPSAELDVLDDQGNVIGSGRSKGEAVALRDKRTAMQAARSTAEELKQNLAQFKRVGILFGDADQAPLRDNLIDRLIEARVKITGALNEGDVDRYKQQFATSWNRGPEAAAAAVDSFVRGLETTFAEQTKSTMAQQAQNPIVSARKSDLGRDAARAKKAQPEHRSAIEWAQKHPTDPRAQEILRMHGGQ